MWNGSLSPCLLDLGFTETFAEKRLLIFMINGEGGCPSSVHKWWWCCLGVLMNEFDESLRMVCFQIRHLYNQALKKGNTSDTYADCCF